MVRFLKANRKAYDGLFETSVENIMHLVNSVPASEMAEILKIEEPETDLVAEIQLFRLNHEKGQCIRRCSDVAHRNGARVLHK